MKMRRMGCAAAAVLVLLFVFLGLQMAGCGKETVTEKGEASPSENTAAGTEIVTEEASKETSEAEENRLYLNRLSAKEYVTLGEYKGLTAQGEKAEVTQEMVEESISYVLASDVQKVEITDRDVVQEGDIADISYEGKKDGVAFEGGTAANYHLAIGSGSFIEGFEEGLVGVKVGDTVDLDLTFPEGYPSEALAGADVVFTVTVHRILEEQIPELTDDYVKTLGIEGVTNTEEYRDYARRSIEEANEESFVYDIQLQLISQTVENATVSEPPLELVNHYQAVTRQQMESQAYYSGMDLETFLGAYYGLTMEAFEEEMAAGAVETAKQALVCKRIAETEGIQVTDAELAEHVATIYGDAGVGSVEEFFAHVDREEYRDSLLIEEVLWFLYDNAVITE
ncbi:MAG: trigger factor [Lachnospiraceae bacterium]|nr:trigger factor [Lachnospiraceae bacterium]